MNKAERLLRENIPYDAIKTVKDLLMTADGVLELTEQYVNSEKITFEAVDAFIDTVYVYDPGKVEIIFRFGDELEKFLNGIPDVDGKVPEK